MPHLPTAQEWLTQSSLLIQARPTTTRITTKYNLQSPSAAAKKRTRKRKAPSSASDDAATSNAPDPAAVAPEDGPRGTLIFKTFDPQSGTTLKYETNRAQEVGRLVQILGRLGKVMAGLEMETEDMAVGKDGDGSKTVQAVEAVAEVAKSSLEKVAATVGTTSTASGPSGGTIGKKGKKKGKR